MHSTGMRYLLVAAGALIVGLLAAGTPVRSLLPLVLLLACPLMMVFMMAGHGGTNRDADGHGGAARERDDAPADR
jgi:Protein of unknown function (DUF2933)